MRQCAPVTRCTLPATAPRTNDDLRKAIDMTQAAWAECAARVDMIAACQEEGFSVTGKADHE